MIIFLLVLVFVAVAAGLVWFFLSHDQGAKEPVGALWVACGFGFAGGILAVLIENLLFTSFSLSPAAPLFTIFLSTLAVGAIEEASKFIPLALYIYPRGYFNEHTDGIIYFAIAGLGFGLPENILYTLDFGAGAGFYRVLFTPVFHAATTGIIGYFFIKLKLAQRSWLNIWWVLGLVMLLHGLYDFGLTSGRVVLELLSVVITVGVSAALFIFYHKAQKLDQAAGLRQPILPIPAPPVFQAPVADNGALLSYVPVNQVSTALPSRDVLSDSLPPVTVQQSHGLEAVLALVFGIFGLIVSLFIPIYGFILAIIGIILGTLTRHSSKRNFSTAGLIVSILAFIVSLGSWVYYFQHM